MKKGNMRKYITLFILGIAGSAIYRLPFLRENYYAAMQQATGATNAQLGMLMGAYGFINLLLYLPGGWAADRFPAKKLIAFSCVSTGVLGFWFASFPNFPIIVIIHGLFAITTVFTFWSASIGVIRDLGDSSQQGKLFGSWHALKGITSTVLGFITVPIFVHFGEGSTGLRATIIFYSIMIIVVGILCWFLIEDGVKESAKSTFKAKDMLLVFKMPTMWLAGMLVLCTWATYIGFGMITPYLSQVCNLGDATVATLSTVRANLLFALGGVIGGFLSDKVGSKIKFMAYMFIGMIVFTAVFAFVPGNTAPLALIVGTMIILGAFIYSAVSVFFSIIDELDVPSKLTGTASGIMCLVGYCPDIFLYTTLGKMVDKAPGFAGYQHIFFLMIGCATVGLICAIILSKMKKNKATVTNEEVNAAA